jgi:hypothetical protein
MASFTGLPRAKRSKAGAFRRARISCSRGKPQNSSPTGKGYRKAQQIVSNSSKTDFPCLETKSARSFSAPTELQSGRKSARWVSQDAAEQAPVQLRISRSNLVRAAHSQDALGAEYLSLHLRSSRRARAVEEDRGLRVCPRPRPRRPLQRALLRIAHTERDDGM